MPCSIANADAFWVVGSFAIEENAVSEAGRLAERLDRAVTTRFEANTGTWRVLVPAAGTSRDELGSAGLSGWRVTYPDDAEPAMKNDQPSAPAMTGQASTPTTPPQQPLYPPLAPGESEMAYCQRVPEAALCKHPEFEAIRARLQALQSVEQELSARCQAPTTESEQTICRQWLESRE